MIRLTHVNMSDILFLMDVLCKYRGWLQSMPQVGIASKAKKEESIVTELWYKLKPKIEKPLPTKRSSLSLWLHQAIVLQDALLYYQREEQPNEFQNSRSEYFKLLLNPQLC